MKSFRSPTTAEMVSAYQSVKSIGLTNIRLGNIGVFAHTKKDQDFLMANVERNAF
jgi:ferredoxin